MSWQMRMKLALGGGWLMALYLSYFVAILAIPSFALLFFFGSAQVSASDWLILGAIFPAAILGMIILFTIILWIFSFRLFEDATNVEPITNQGIKAVVIGLGGILLIHIIWSAMIAGMPILEGLTKGPLDFPLRDLFVFHGIFLCLYIAYFVFFWLWCSERRKNGREDSKVINPSKVG